MVGPLKLTQFYGHSLPRPRIYADVKFNDHRVDPPPSVNDALLSWANDAPWSMGGLSQRRVRAQGKFEGSARKLRSLLEEEEEDGKPLKAEPLAERGDAHSDDDDAIIIATPAGKMRKRDRIHHDDAETTARNGTPSTSVQETPVRAGNATGGGSSGLSQNRKGKLTPAAAAAASPPPTRKTRSETKSPSPLTMKVEFDEGRLTRSSKKLKRSGGRDADEERVSSSTRRPSRTVKEPNESTEYEKGNGKGPVRRLLSNTEEDKISDDESKADNTTKKRSVGSPVLRRSTRKG